MWYECADDVRVSKQACHPPGFTAGSGIPEPQIASVWEGTEGKFCYMLGLFHTRSWASAVVCCQRGDLGPGRLLASSFGHSCRRFPSASAISLSVSHSSSWCLQRVPIQMLAQSVLITKQSCHLLWSAQEELETPGLPLSSKLPGHLSWFLRD